MKSKNIEVLGLWLALGFTANSLLACGPDFPNNLLDSGGDAVLAAPRSNFYRELDRLHLAPAGFQAVPATNSVAEQNIALEQGDLIIALRRAGASSADARQIAAAQLGERMKLQVFNKALKRWSNSAPETWDAQAQKYVREQPAGAPPLFPAIQVVAGLPDEFADYFEGALAWFDPRVADKSTSRQSWERLLALPPAQRHFKSVAAAFMLGKSWAQANPAQAAGYFQQVRALAKSGFADAAGLAAASFGEEARLDLERKQFVQAIGLYLDQLATGDLTAANSLRFAAARALKTDDAATLNQLAADPRARRVITASLISRGPDWQSETGDARKRWLAAVEAADIREAESAEEFALAAYQAGEWDQAQRWIDRAPGSPTAQWLQVKLWLRAGKTDDAARLLAALCHSFPMASPAASRQRAAAVQEEIRQRQYNLPLESPVTNAPAGLTDNLTVNGFSYWTQNIDAPSQMLGELGVLHLARREYTEALEALLRAGFWMDAAYVAERVLTVDELKTYVDSNWPVTTGNVHGSNMSAEEDAAENDSLNPRPKIRYLLARRLTRLERGPEATVYYPTEWQSALTNLLQALADGRNESLPARERFYALVAAADRTRTNGMELIGTELAPDWHIYDGGFDYGLTTASRQTGLLPASDDELSRTGQHGVMPEERFHYRHLAAALKQAAAQQGWEAAKLLPDNSDETALILCRSGSWLEPKPAAAYYHAILQRCRQTEVGEETARIGGFPKLDENGRVIRRQLNAEDFPQPGKAYVVHAGDTLFHIAAVVSANGLPLTVTDLLLANPKLKTDAIRAGQMMDIPAFSLSEPGQPGEESARPPVEVETSTASAGQSVSGERYVIQAGDSLAKIAQAVSAFGWQLSVQDILDANPDLVVTHLKIGQTIVIPLPPDHDNP